MKRVSGLTFLALAAVFAWTSSAAAAQPSLAFSCNQPILAVVTCHLSGRGFAPHEHVSISYQVVVSLANKKPQTTVYRSTALVDGHGAFTDRALRFHAGPGLGFDVRVEARASHVVVT